VIFWVHLCMSQHRPHARILCTCKAMLQTLLQSPCYSQWCFSPSLIFYRTISLTSIVVEWVAILLIWELRNGVSYLKMDGVVFMIIGCADINNIRDIHSRFPFRHTMPDLSNNLFRCLWNDPLVEILMKSVSKLRIQDSLTRSPGEDVSQRVLDRFDIYKFWYSPFVWLHPLLVESTSIIISSLEYNCNRWKLLWSCILAFSCKDTQVLWNRFNLVGMELGCQPLDIVTEIWCRSRLVVPVSSCIHVNVNPLLKLLVACWKRINFSKLYDSISHLAFSEDIYYEAAAMPASKAATAAAVLDEPPLVNFSASFCFFSSSLSSESGVFAMSFG